MKEIYLLIATATTLGFVHTIVGPDHYLPFIVISKARNWSVSKTVFITFVCGFGHILSSVVIGFIGIIFGVAVFRIESIESFRGDVAAWLLIVFGFTYFTWGLWRAISAKPHTHSHFHTGIAKHVHTHNHERGHVHLHKIKDHKSLTPWALFIIFIFGPCEPLIPILMYPAAKNSLMGVIAVILAFSLATILTMLGVVLFSLFGLSKVYFNKVEKYSHALAGLVILLSGGAIKLLNL